MGTFGSKANDIASNVVDHAADSAKYAKKQARGSVVELGTQVLKLVNMLGAFELRTMDSVLHRVGLQRRESLFRPVVFFAAGAVAGGAAALIFSPKSGADLRQTVISFFEKEKDAALEAVKAKRDEIREDMNNTASQHS